MNSVNSDTLQKYLFCSLFVELFSKEMKKGDKRALPHFTNFYQSKIQIGN